MRPCLSLEPITSPSFLAATTARFSIPFSSRVPQSVVFASPRDFNLKFRPFSPSCSDPDGSITLHEKAADGEDEEEFRDPDTLSEGEAESVSGDGVYIEITRTGKNTRRILSRIGIDATLETIWGILTDYERLADFIPGLAVSELMEKGENFARLYQIGEQNLAFGLKFNAKGVVDCYEKDLEDLPNGQKRDIEFKMIEGDFQVFEGKWSIKQFDAEHNLLEMTSTWLVKGRASLLPRPSMP
ncbi:uncharacterized protein LOC116193532 isoform X2 [Punica granatum]|uniref:Uncharacterized protein LOC116193532 isoform X2 n=1 Tax=Punica granatum TaxID=22663 RepID=A0A6P8C3N4_PUNGR|nr:uncharacterized protein LOC116193532 isoform X2 [Punica granatum]